MLRRSPLHAEHLALGADMGEYRWADMPLPWRYPAPVDVERDAVRHAVGINDASQLRVLRVAGPGAVACLEALSPRRLADMAVGSSRYGVVLNRFGRIVDEALILRVAPEELWVSHGAGSAAERLAALVADLPDGAVAVHALELAVIAVQGPASATLVDRLLAGEGPSVASTLRRMAHAPGRFGAVELRVSRTGFTGELGYELWCPAADAVALWRALLAAGAPLGARPYAYACVDLLRIEAGFLLYPNDLAMAGSLEEVGLGWMRRADPAGDPFRPDEGASVAGPSWTVSGLRVPGRVEVPRGSIVQRAGAAIGQVTSSAWSPQTGEVLCLARLRRPAPPPGAPVEVNAHAGRLAALPFISRAVQP